MYKFEKKIQEAEKRGIHFSEGQMTYIRCARINGIDLLDQLYVDSDKPEIAGGTVQDTSQGTFLSGHTGQLSVCAIIRVCPD